MTRAVERTLIRLGLLQIPVKLFSTIDEQRLSFVSLHSCGQKLKQIATCPDCGPVDPATVRKGYEYARDCYLMLTETEVAELGAPTAPAVILDATCTPAEVPALQLDRSYYLGIDLGGERTYRLLGEALRSAGLVARGRRIARGKEELCIVAPAPTPDGPLVLHLLRYPSEVRDPAQVPTGDPVDLDPGHVALARALVEELRAPVELPAKSPELARMRALLEARARGEPVPVTAAAAMTSGASADPGTATEFLDLETALRKSLRPARPPHRAGPRGARAARGAKRHG